MRSKLRIVERRRNFLTANKFLKADEGKTVTSTDIQINDVKDLSTRLSNVEAKNTFQNLSIF